MDQNRDHTVSSSSDDHLDPTFDLTGQNMYNPDMNVAQEHFIYKTHFENQATYPFMNTISDYRKICRIGLGSTGLVYHGIHRQTKNHVALKQLLMEGEIEGFPITALREIKILKKLSHPNIIELNEVVNENKQNELPVFYLVFPFCPYDLTDFLHIRGNKLEFIHLKTLMKHLFAGVNKIHSCQVLHRDLKPRNLLISEDGILKIADFGLARDLQQEEIPSFDEHEHSPRLTYTNPVITLWYRPPEYLLGKEEHHPSMDMWSVGCIMAELWLRYPLLQGPSEKDQLSNIAKMCGPINEEEWPGIIEMPFWNILSIWLKSEQPPGSQNKLRQQMETLMTLVSPDGIHFDEQAFRLLELLLSIDPELRPAAHQANIDEWFSTAPVPQENIADLMQTLRTNPYSRTFTGTLPAHFSSSINYPILVVIMQFADVPPLSSSSSTTPEPTPEKPIAPEPSTEDQQPQEPEQK